MRRWTESSFVFREPDNGEVYRDCTDGYYFCVLGGYNVRLGFIMLLLRGDTCVQ